MDQTLITETLRSNNGFQMKHVLQTILSPVFLQKAAFIGFNCWRLMVEYKRIEPTKVVQGTSMSIWEKFTYVLAEQTIGHAGHFQGALFGVFAGSVLLLQSNPSRSN